MEICFAINVRKQPGVPDAQKWAYVEKHHT